jgi:glycerol-3-phosphate acyltransferase PlsY
MAFTRMVSMGSIGAAILFPVLTLFINNHFIVEASGIKYFVYSVILAALVIFNHRENIKRIANGTENKLSFKDTNK